MTVPPTHSLHELGSTAEDLAKHCKSERLAITLQCVAIGSMIVTAGAAATHLMKDLFRHSERHGRSK